MDIPPHKIKAVMVTIVTLGIGVGIPLILWIQNQNFGNNFKGELDLQEFQQIAQLQSETSGTSDQNQNQGPRVPPPESPDVTSAIAVVPPATPDASGLMSNQILPPPIAETALQADLQTESTTANPQTFTPIPSLRPALSPDQTPAPTPQSPNSTSGSNNGSAPEKWTPVRCSGQQISYDEGKEVQWTAVVDPEYAKGKEFNYVWFGRASGTGKTVYSKQDLDGIHFAKVQIEGGKHEANCIAKVSSYPPTPSPNVSRTPTPTPGLEPSPKPVTGQLPLPPPVLNPPTPEKTSAPEPENFVTRGEAIVIIAKATEYLKENKIEPHEGCYTPDCGAGNPDIWKDITNAEQGRYIREFGDRKYVQGTGPNEFSPDVPLLGRDAIKILGKVFPNGEAIATDNIEPNRSVTLVQLVRTLLQITAQ